MLFDGKEVAHSCCLRAGCTIEAYGCWLEQAGSSAVNKSACGRGAECQVKSASPKMNTSTSICARPWTQQSQKPLLIWGSEYNHWLQGVSWRLQRAGA